MTNEEFYETLDSLADLADQSKECGEYGMAREFLRLALNLARYGVSVRVF